MSSSHTSSLLARLATAFAVSFLLLTGALLANYGLRYISRQGAGDVGAGAIGELLALAVPFTAALTIPMAVFVAVLWVLTRPEPSAAVGVTRPRHSARGVLLPILGAATVVASLTTVLNTRLVPRANERLAAVTSGGEVRRGDRMMTTTELKMAAERARSEATVAGLTRAATFEVEIHKKYALAAAVLILALAAVAIAFRFPGGGLLLIAGSSILVFGFYYFSLIAGETLGDRLTVPPLVAMWLPNLLLLVASVLSIRGGTVRGRGGAAGSLSALRFHLPVVGLWRPESPLASVVPDTRQRSQALLAPTASISRAAALEETGQRVVSLSSWAARWR